MSDRDRLTQLIASVRSPFGVVAPNIDEPIADAILADGWVRLADADTEAMYNALVDPAADRYAELGDLYPGAIDDANAWVNGGLAAAFGKDTPLPMAPAPDGSRVLVVEEADSE